jgi:diphosphomevalonate decarboxylase
VVIEGTEQDPRRFAAFFDALRSHRAGVYFTAESSNSFPTAAGLASSSSGFAALAGACAAAAGLELSPAGLSALARIGSASAARSLFGGFVALHAGAERAEQLFDEHHWPDLRVVLVAVRSAPKSIPSREAMERSRTTSPYYESWVSTSRSLFDECRTAVERRDIEELGPVVRQSYLRMFGTMFSASPPVIYWHPDSLSMISLCEEMRRDGLQTWETMDAGPQVKIVCLQNDLDEITGRIAERNAEWRIMIAAPGPGPRRIR